jgi:hypothetical protein
MANPLRGAQLWEEISIMLDSVIIETQQAIDINNKAIWDPYLHTWSNEDWADMLSIIDHAVKTTPDIARDYHRTNILNAQAVLDKGGNRALDKKDTKRYAWSMIMTMREMYNKLHGWDIKNAPGQSWPPASSDNSFGDNFTVN